MFNLGMGEITVILLLALIFLGPKKLPELASGLGKLIREIRKTTADVKNEIQLDDSIRKPFEELREAVTLHPDELKRRDNLRKELANIQRQAEAAVAAAEDLASTAPAGDAPVGEPDATEGSSTAATNSMSSDEHVAATGAGDQTLADIAPPPPLSPFATPAVPGAAPVGTVARGASGAMPTTGSGAVAAPPAPPLAAVLAKGSGPVNTPNDRRTAHPPTGSDFLRSLRAVPEGTAVGVEGQDTGQDAHAQQDTKQENRIGRLRHPRPAAGVVAPAPNSAADRSNVTQALTEADLAAITVGRPPPPPPPPPLPTSPSSASAVPGSRNLPPSAPHATTPPPAPARLPGATPPPKSSNR